MQAQNMSHELIHPSEVLVSTEITLASGQTLAEERFNTWTHGLGLVCSLLGFGFLALKAAKMQGLAPIFCCSLYATALVMMFASSTLYHSRPDGRLKELFRVGDHICIYFLIAGTFTPFAVLVLKQQTGHFVLWLMWSIALGGTLYKIFAFGRFPGLSLALYLGMGWSGVLVFAPLKAAMTSQSFSLLVWGGIFYSVGTIFYAVEKIPYNHGIWHLFVMAGAGCHFFSLYSALSV